jgi:hypothetical protein
VRGYDAPSLDYAARVRRRGAALRTVLAASSTARSAVLTALESGKASATSGARTANSGPSSAASAFTARMRRSEGENRFAYGFRRQLLAFEATPFRWGERARGDDADRRFILNLDVDDEKKSSEQRVAHDLHPVLVVCTASVFSDLRERVGKDGRGFFEGYPMLATVGLRLRAAPDEREPVELEPFAAAFHWRTLHRASANRHKHGLAMARLAFQ